MGKSCCLLGGRVAACLRFLAARADWEGRQMLAASYRASVVAHLLDVDGGELEQEVWRNFGANVPAKASAGRERAEALSHLSAASSGLRCLGGLGQQGTVH